MKPSIVFLSLFCFSFGAANSMANASLSVLGKLEEGETVDALLLFQEQADLKKAESISNRNERLRWVYQELKSHAQKSQKKVLEKLNGVDEVRSFHIINAIHVKNLNSKVWADIAPLQKDFRVVENRPSQWKEIPISKKVEEKQNGGTIPANLVAIGADKVWKEFQTRGQGIVIAGQDGGFHWQHPALKNQYRGFFGLNANHNYNWYDAIHRGSGKNPGCSTGDSAEPCDDSGHGTHTMGTMVGDDGGSNLLGVAPDAKWIGCRNMKKGVGTPATYLECFEFFLSPFPLGGNSKDDGVPELAPHIVNNSWSCPPEEGCKGEEFLQAIRSLHAAGILVVVAAGNEGPGCESLMNPPGYYVGEVLSVGATDHRDGKIADFSSRGPSKWNDRIGPLLSAPGSLIRSAVPPSSDGSYEHKSGTSMASPHVAGAVALLWSAVPSFVGKIPDTMRLLEMTADAKTSSQSCKGSPGNQIPNSVFGYGSLNIYKAIQKAKESGL